MNSRIGIVCQMVGTSGLRMLAGHRGVPADNDRRRDLASTYVLHPLN
jgi:hypothetical protein